MKSQPPASVQVWWPSKLLMLKIISPAVLLLMAALIGVVLVAIRGNISFDSAAMASASVASAFVAVWLANQLTKKRVVGLVLTTADLIEVRRSNSLAISLRDAQLISDEKSGIIRIRGTDAQEIAIPSGLWIGRHEEIIEVISKAIAAAQNHDEV